MTFPFPVSVRGGVKVGQHDIPGKQKMTLSKKVAKALGREIFSVTAKGGRREAAAKRVFDIFVD